MGIKKTKEHLIKESETQCRHIVELEKSKAKLEQINEQLRGKESKYHALFKGVKDGIVLIDSETGFIVDCNPEFESQTGRKLKQLKQMKIWEVRPPEKVSAAKKNFLTIKDKGVGISAELEYQKPDGEIVPIEFVSKRMRIQGRDYIGSIARDITERKRTEEALKESEERYRLLFNKMLIGSTLCEAIYDETGKVTDFVFLEVNPAYEKITGLKAKDIIGKPVRQVSPTMDPRLIEMHGHVALTGEPLYIKDFYSALFDKHFEVTHYSPRKGQFATCLVDITERKKTEEELREYREHLEDLVGKRTAQLAEANKKLEQEITERKRVEKELEKLYKKEKEWRHELEVQMKQRIDFTRALVHELKTPLTPIQAASELLIAELQEEPWLSLAQRIHRGARNLNRRINELLDLAKGEMGILQLRRQPFNPLQLLQEVADYVTPEAEAKGQTLRLDLSPSLPAIRGNQDRLRQVMLNLFDNAFKFTPEGGRITLRAEQKDGKLIVKIQDTGHGISKEEQKRLFEPYYRLEKDRQHMSGLGLGLALSKTIVELHGGQIWVESQKGKGSTFTVAIPSYTPKSKRNITLNKA